mgnify:CR=1 FL=1|tara:strand:- start:782 stop:1942 length:1161 start_codon:yes stop_codon:yes gene_type:complete
MRSLFCGDEIEVSERMTKIFRGDAHMHTCGATIKFSDYISDAIPVSLKCHDRSIHADKICAIGDIHGDIEAAMGCFNICPCISAKKVDDQTWKVRWGNKDERNRDRYAVVQCGDIVDRRRSGGGDTEIEAEEELIIFACAMLSVQASCLGSGSFIRLIGNHEIMNLQGQLDYASEKSKRYYSECCGGRRGYFYPGQEGAKRLCCHFGTRAVLRIGNFVFMHAGVADRASHETTRGVLENREGSLADRINQVVHEFAAGTASPSELDDVSTYMWDRTQGKEDESVWCSVLQGTLNSFVAENRISEKLNLVLGHCNTPGIHSLCEFEGKNRVHRIDVAMSRGFDHDGESCQHMCSSERRPQILHILDPLNGDVNIIESEECLRRVAAL